MKRLTLALIYELIEVTPTLSIPDSMIENPVGFVHRRNRVQRIS
jgi:hypothetical protein